MDAGTVTSDAGLTLRDASALLDAATAGDAANVSADAGLNTADAGAQVMDAGRADAAPVDPCVDVVCPAHASCQATPQAACWCDVGYQGPQCEQCEPGYTQQTDGTCLAPVLFMLPMDNPDGGLIQAQLVGYDNDPTDAALDIFCSDHEGRAFPYCYDQHTGTDMLLVGSFDRMDNGSATVFAAADGVVVYVRDGEFDRCALDILQARVVCPGYPNITPANRVIIEHADGKRSSYLHLKKNSILVTVGDVVVCGEPIALVGSSGNSSAPHLHFTVTKADGTTTDAFSGPGSHPESHWVQQDGPNGLPAAICQ